MWHEARRREKATQKLLNDHRKRAEKRRQEDRIDPNSLLQVHGIKSKLYPDLSAHKQIAKSLVVWQGDRGVTIDRFDVRATLTAIPSESTAKGTKANIETKKTATVVDMDESETMKKLLTYERYRLLMQNELNQVPEGTRLRLVEQSEHLGDARLRKLQRNRFGTSGEATSLQEPKSTNQNRVSHSREKPVGVSIGYNYNQSSTQLVDQGDEFDSHHVRNIVDLDDYGDFDLDDIMKPQSSTKKVNEITSRYGISSDEFNLLIDADRDDSHQSDLIKELKRVKDKAIKKSMSKTYGPVLPPDMETATASKSIKRSSSNASSTHSSPVGQRSPSGADIPLRNGDNTSQNEPGIHAEESKPESENKVELWVEPEIKVRLRIEPEAKIKPRAEPEFEQLPSTSGLNDKNIEQLPKIDSNQKNERPRRAATPLAYRKHRRSSRSLSRERHTSHRKSRGYRRTSSTRRQSRSNSSDDSSSSSSRSSQSFSSSSSSSCPSSSSSHDDPRSGRSRHRRTSCSSVSSHPSSSNSPRGINKRSKTKHTEAHPRRSRHSSQRSPKKRG